MTLQKDGLHGGINNYLKKGQLFIIKTSHLCYGYGVFWVVWRKK